MITCYMCLGGWWDDYSYKQSRHCCFSCNCKYTVHCMCLLYYKVTFIKSRVDNSMTIVKIYSCTQYMYVTFKLFYILDCTCNSTLHVSFYMYYITNEGVVFLHIQGLTLYTCTIIISQLFLV